jgi:putative restriction endonuclease
VGRRGAEGTRVAFGAPDQGANAARIKAPTPPENPLERRYALRAVKQRLHQASFREAVITAYKRAVRIA